MTSLRDVTVGVLSFGLVALCVPAMAADDSGTGGKGKGMQQEREAFRQQNSDKMQQGQDMINQQPMSSQQSDKHGSDMKPGQSSRNTGADLSGGRDSHLGPHDSQDSQSSKKGMKGGGEHH